MSIIEIFGAIIIVTVFGFYVYLISPKQRDKTISYLRNTTKQAV